MQARKPNMHGEKSMDSNSISDWPSETDKIWLIPPLCDFFLFGSTSIVDGHRNDWRVECYASMGYAMHLFGKQWEIFAFMCAPETMAAYICIASSPHPQLDELCESLQCIIRLD